MVNPSGQTKTDTETRILDAADEIFLRRGIDGARMQEIADHARVAAFSVRDMVRVLVVPSSLAAIPYLLLQPTPPPVASRP